MKSKVFISWSGEPSGTLAIALRNWLPSVLQYVQPYCSSSDIEKGSRWNSDLQSQLQACDVGIFCVTYNNANSPWMLFEAGAIAKKLEESKVCTALFGVEPADITGPLSMFQHTRFEKGDFKRLITTINHAAAENQLDAVILKNTFEAFWPGLEAELKNILEKHKSASPSVSRTDRELLEEILELSRIRHRSQGNVPILSTEPYPLQSIRFSSAGIPEVISRPPEHFSDSVMSASTPLSRLMSSPIMRAAHEVSLVSKADQGAANMDSDANKS
jgi:hypothetical protein